MNSIFTVIETAPQAFNVTFTPPTQINITLSTGIPGRGVQSGGLTGQVLAKKSDADYDTQWINNASSNALIYALIFG